MNNRILVSYEDLKEVDAESLWTDLVRVVNSKKENKLLNNVFSFYGIEDIDKKINTRERNVVKAKRLYCYLEYVVFNSDISVLKKSLSDVAKDVKLTNHGTVLFHVDVFKNLISTNIDYRLEVIKFARLHLTDKKIDKLKRNLDGIEPIVFNEIRDARIVQSTGRKQIRFR